MADDKDKPNGGVRHDPTAVPGKDYNPQPGEGDPTDTVPDAEEGENDPTETPG